MGVGRDASWFPRVGPRCCAEQAVQGGSSPPPMGGWPDRRLAAAPGHGRASASLLGGGRCAV